MTWQAAPKAIRTCKILIGLKAYDRDGNAVKWVGNVETLEVSAREYRSLQKKGIQVHLEIDLPGGDFRLVTAVYDWNSRKAGTLELPVEAGVDQQSFRQNLILREQIAITDVGLPLCANVNETGIPSTIDIGQGKKSYLDFYDSSVVARHVPHRSELLLHPRNQPGIAFLTAGVRSASERPAPGAIHILK